MTSDSFMIKRSSPSILTSVPDHLPNTPRSPALSSSGPSFPLSSRAPGPTGMISPSCGFSLTVSGIMMPPLRLVLALDAADDDTVVQWTEFHGLRSRFDLRCRLPARYAGVRLGSQARRRWLRLA